MLELKEKKAVLNLYDNSTVKWEEEGKRYCLHIRQDSEPGNPREWEDNIDIMACWHGNYSLGDKVDEKTPEEFWRRLVRENVSNAEIYAAAEAGKLYGIRLAPNAEEPERIDVYETYYLRTVIGNSDASEVLEYEALSKDGVVDYIMDDLTASHCMTLMEPYAEWLPLWLYDHSGITMSCGARHYPYNDQWDSGCVGWIVMLKEKAMSELGADEETWRERAMACMETSVKTYDQYLTGDVYGYTLYVEETGEGGKAEWVEIDSSWGFFGSDVMESGLAENVSYGLWEAIQEDRYEVGEAVLKTASWYEF